MYCNKCGKKLENQGKFCPRCGAKINIAVTNGSKYEDIQKYKEQGRKNVILKVLIGVVLVLAISGGIFIVSKLLDVEQYFACVQDENMKFGFIDKA